MWSPFNALCVPLSIVTCRIERQVSFVLSRAIGDILQIIGSENYFPSHKSARDKLDDNLEPIKIGHGGLQQFVLDVRFVGKALEDLLNAQQINHQISGLVELCVVSESFQIEKIRFVVVIARPYVEWWSRWSQLYFSDFDVIVPVGVVGVIDVVARLMWLLGCDDVIDWLM